MIEIFTQAIIQPNFDKIQPPKSTIEIISQIRSDYKIAAKNNSQLNFDRFLPKKSPPGIIRAPKIEDHEAENDHDEKPIKPQITKESKKNISQWLKNFLVKNSADVRRDIDNCLSAKGKSVVVRTSGGEGEIQCVKKDKSIVQIDKNVETSRIVEEMATNSFESEVELKYVTNVNGKKVIGFTQENFSTPKKVLFEGDGFILREGTTYNEFFKMIQTEIIKEAVSIKHDLFRLNMRGQTSSFGIESINGQSVIKCLNKDGTDCIDKDLTTPVIDFNRLSHGTQRFVKILEQSSKYGYSTKFKIDHDNKFTIQPKYLND